MKAQAGTLHRLRTIEIAPVIWISGVMILLWAIVAPGFFSINNAQNILLSVAPLLIAALGQTIILLTEGIDLSIGYVVAMCGMASASLVGLPLPIVIVGGIATGGVFGFLNGILISKGGLPPFISTLGVGQVVFGLGLLLTRGLTVAALDDQFRWLGSGELIGIPFAFIVATVVFALMWFLMNRTTFGRSVHGLGGNQEALRLSGVNVAAKKIVIYTTAGLLYGVAGVLLASRSASGNIGMAVGWEFQTLAAVLIGGTSFNEGRGSINKTVLGVFLVGILRNGLNVAGVPNMYQYLLIGLVVVGAIVLDVVVRARRETRSAGGPS
jgi:ribose transport system permease protein